MIKRTLYLDALGALKDLNIIKVITGVRRSGKSTLLEMYRGQLVENGVSEQNIIALNFEEMENNDLKDPNVLHTYVMDNLGEGKNYVFLDEIQNVPRFEEVVDSLYVKKNIDLYITGSNAYFLSSDLATLLSGRYIEINVFPLSFAEYVSAFDNVCNLDLLLQDYLIYGSFPEVAKLLAAGQKDVINDYLLGIYNTVVTKDVVERNNVTDVTTLNDITKFVLDNTGSLISPQRIADYLTAQNNKTTRITVDKYLSALVKGLIFYRADRQNIRGKRILQTLQKYYVVDTGLRRAMLGLSASADFGHLLENVVYFELLRRRNFVYVAKTHGAEVDFVARNINTNQVAYYQVAYTVKGDETLARELSPLQKIKDHYPKYLLTTDPFTFDENGITHLNVAKWLLGME